MFNSTYREGAELGPIAAAYGKLSQEEWDTNPQRETNAYYYTCDRHTRRLHSYSIFYDEPNKQPEYEYIEPSKDLSPQGRHGHNVSQEKLDEEYKHAKQRLRELRAYIRQVAPRLEENYENQQVDVLDKYSTYLFHAGDKLRIGLKEAEKERIDRDY